MKARFLALAALVLGMVSCQQEFDGAAQVGGEVDFQLQVAAPELSTRADGDERNGHDSAYGAIDYLTDWSEVDLRYTLEVYDVIRNEAGEVVSLSETPVKDRMVQVVGEYKPVSFDLRLVPNREYRFVVFADFVDADGNGKHHLIGETLQNIEVVNDGINDECTDAYFATKDITITNSAAQPMVLKRPYGKVRVIATDLAELNLNVNPGEVVVEYEAAHVAGFNAVTGEIDATTVWTSTTYGCPYAETVSKETLADHYYTEGYDEMVENGRHTHMTLFTDYILANESQEAIHFTMTVNDKAGQKIKTTEFYTDIPVQRNHLTTIIGNVLTTATEINVTIDDNFAGPENIVNAVEVYDAADLQEAINEATSETHIVLTGNIDLNDLVGLTRAEAPATITVPNGKVVTIDLGGYTLTATDTTAKNYSAIDNRGTLTVMNGTISVTATIDSDWNRYSAVLANNPGGNLTVDGVTLQHNGGTDMAYGIDNLTNGKGTYAVTTIKNSTIKSTYRAVRQFLNGVEATNEMYVKAGAKLYGDNKSIFFHDPSKSANTGKLVVEEGAELYGDVYLFVTAGSTEWPVEVSIAASTLKGESKVTSGNVPAGYAVYEKDGNWVAEKGVEENGDKVSLSNIGGLKWLAEKVNAGDTFEGKTVVLAADIDLKNENWTPIGYWETFNGTFDGKNHTISNLKHHGTEEDCYVGLFGYTENATIKNLTINNVDLKLVANNEWAGGHMGALVGNIDGNTVIENIKVTGDVKIEGDLEKAGAGRIGGVVGGNVAKVSFKDVVVNANKGSFVQGNSSIGGIAGQLQGETTFVNCSSNIDVTAQQFYAGGIIGLAYRITSFENCSASGNISVLAGRSGNNNDLYRVGGIAGGWDEDDNGEYILPLVNCSTTCVLTGKSADGRTATAFDCGGFVGRGYGAMVGAMVSVNGTVYEYAGEGVYKIGDSYVVNTGDALVAALAQKYDVTFGQDLKIDPANMSNAYGKTGVLVYDGQTIDGAGHKLDVKGAGGTWDSGICTSGGLIKNIWVTGSFRGVFVKGATHVEKVVLDNVRIEGTTYTISCDQASGQGLEATNSIFRGWTSYAKTIGNVKFDGCTFGAGNGYNFSRPYAPTEYVNCNFEAGHAIDPRAAVTFENCTFNGVALTAENLSTLVTSNLANASVK